MHAPRSTVYIPHFKSYQASLPKRLVETVIGNGKQYIVIYQQGGLA